MNRKNGFGLLTAALLSLVAFSVVSAEPLPTPSFSDVNSDHRNYNAITQIAEQQIVEGYKDGTFAPSKKIQRDEFVKIVLEASDISLVNYEPRQACQFPDMEGQWSNKYIATACEYGFIEGYDDGNFQPARNINFAEASKIVNNILVGANDDPELFPLEKEWYTPHIYSLQNKKAIPDDISSFAEDLTRGQMAEMVWRLIEEKTDQPSKTYAAILGVPEPEPQTEPATTLSQFTSCSEFQKHLRYSSMVNNQMYNDNIPYAILEAVDVEGPDSAAPAESRSSSSEESSNDFSETNIQVEGVDEADIVKTDGEYIYVVQDQGISINRVNPVENLAEVNFVEFPKNFSARDIYVDGNKLVVMGSRYNGYIGDYYQKQAIRAAYIPYTFRPAVTMVISYDITDKTNVTTFREVEIEGSLVTSRKIDDVVYTVTNRTQPSSYYEVPLSEENIVPTVYDSASESTTVKPAVGCEEILYYPGDLTETNVIVSAIPVAELESVTSEVILGSGQNVYASRDHLYVAETPYSNWWWSNVSESKEETIISKFSLAKDDIRYLGNGKVPGHILNQFSMDEHDGNFRIATTLGNLFNLENKSTNNIYVLDDNMEQIGALEGLASGERIYSSRFLGDRIYMVTFKKVDPLFVIDAADPTKPRVLGELKIPGYSDYLHPFGENYLIGFGKDTVEPVESEEDLGFIRDFAWYQGVKVAMFDITDVTAPKQLHVEIIGDRGTGSALLNNHKALLFAEGKGTDSKTLMGLPISLAELTDQNLKDYDEDPGNNHGQFVGNFGYVYDVSVEDGFELRARINHGEGRDYNSAVNRLLYISDYLYTVSNALIQAHPLNDPETVTNEAKLTY